MCDQTEIKYLDGEVVWVKLGSCWWPGEVVGNERLPPDLMPSFRKAPIAVVKFFEEDSYEYVKNISNIYKYNCSRKNEFIKKGLDMYRSKHAHMEKFPEDIIHAEKSTKGDEDILSRDEFQERKKESYAGLFGDPKKTPKTPLSVKRGRGAKPRLSETSSVTTPIRKLNKGKSDYKVHILVQPKASSAASAEAAEDSSPSTSRERSVSSDDKAEKPTKATAYVPSTPTMSSSGVYSCHACSFSTNRLNVMIMHNKTHSVTFTPYTPSPVRKKPTKPAKSTPKTPKSAKVTKQSTGKREEPTKAQTKKRNSSEPIAPVEVKKPKKTDEEIKTSLLADWDDEDGDSNDEASDLHMKSPEVPCGAEPPALPTADDMCSAQVPQDAAATSTPPEETSPATEKQEPASDAQYDFCEDEDWPVEADAGRKIPRVKNPSKSKSLSLDEEDMAREVAELLSNATVPELPSVPEPLKSEENFPERSVVKSPDKQADKCDAATASKQESQPTNTIFKTKTFFRSRHSRSQDAIGKYIAEQLNAAERMNTPDSDQNGSEVASSPENRESPHAELRVARLAPKIQLKKMKAEAEAQLKQRDRPAEPTERAQDAANVEEVLNTSFTETIDSTSDAKSETRLDEAINKEVNVEANASAGASSEHVEKPVSVTEPYMSESTASAVDALLSVSRDADRVTKIISNDLPEDLFEEDAKMEYAEEDISKHVHSNLSSEPCEVTSTDETVSLNGAQNDIVPIPNVNGKTEVPQETTNNREVVLTTEAIESTELTESDLQIAEALINLPSTAMKNKASIESSEQPKLALGKPICSEKEENTPVVIFDPSETTNALEAPVVSSESASRVETEEEKSENLNAAQSLVQMSKAIDHNVKNVLETTTITETIKNPQFTDIVGNGNGIGTMTSPLHNKTPEKSKKDSVGSKISNSKLLKMLEEPCEPRTITHQVTPVKQTTPVVQSPDKILNFNHGIPANPSPKQKIIIRRTIPSKNLINNLNEPIKQEKIILSRTNKPAQDNIQTYTIQASPDVATDSNTVVIEQKPRKMANVAPKLQKIKPQPTLLALSTDNKVPSGPTATSEDALFDINSMPVVLSDDLLTPENIDKMPIVMSDGNIVTNPTNLAPVNSPQTITTPKLVKVAKAQPQLKKIAPVERTVVSSPMHKNEIKSLILNPAAEGNKLTTPNILSKSTKLRNAKPTLVIDKQTGKQKIIMTKEAVPKEIKQISPKIQNVTQMTNKTEKFIILPTASGHRANRAQKIVIDPATGKAHVLITKGAEAATADAKPVAAKLVPGSATGSPGGTLMIITNTQGTTSRIVLAPEHEKLLFPNKQLSTLTQIKAAPPRIASAANAHKAQTIITAAPPHSAVKTQTKIVPKQKNAIITSKGQLIVGGLVSTTTSNVVTMPEIRPAVTKRIVPAEPKKIIQKTNSEPVIFLQQKSGAVMQLTAAQFEHLQRTGQIVQKSPPATQDNKVLIQKATSPADSVLPIIQKQQRIRPRTTTANSPVPAKKAKHEIILKPAPAPSSPMPSLTPILKNADAVRIPAVSNTVSVATTSSPYTDLDNLEEMLPSTAIATHPDASAAADPPVAPPSPTRASPPPPLVPLAPSAPAPPPQEPPTQPPLAPPVVGATPAADGGLPAPLESQLLAVPGEHFGGPVGSFYLCVEDPPGTVTPIDNRPLVLENNQLVPMALDPAPQLSAQPERRDILEAALANSDVFHGDAPRDDGPDFRDLNANVSVHSCVSETSTTLHQPIMTPVEVPTSGAEPAVPAGIDAGLAVIGVSAQHLVPTSLELPITVTDPRIAPRTTYSAPFAGESMPLLGGEPGVGKSMPILTDEGAAAADEAAGGAWLLAPAADAIAPPLASDAHAP